MNFEELEAYAGVAGPTTPLTPTLAIDGGWLQRFRQKVDAITKDDAVVFAFPVEGYESLNDLERKGELKASAMPYLIPSDRSGLFILNKKTGGQGWHKTFGSVDDLFDFLTSHAALSSCLTLVSAGQSDTMHFFPSGVTASAREQCLEVPLGSKNSLSEKTLVESLNFFATDKALNRPSNRSKLWSDPGKYHPMERAEKAIQELLVLALQMNFQSGVVLDEIPVLSGRTDVVIEERVGDSFVRFLIELKVVRSYSHTGTSYGDPQQFEHCKSGIIQALTNGEDLSVTSAFLSAYDMRKDPDETMKVNVTAVADTLKVKVCWNRVFNTSSADRTARAQTALNDGGLS